MAMAVANPAAAGGDIPQITRELLGEATSLLTNPSPTGQRQYERWIPSEMAPTFKDFKGEAAMSLDIGYHVFNSTTELSLACLGRLAKVIPLNMRGMNKTFMVNVSFDLPAMAVGMAEEALAPIVSRCRTGVVAKAEKFAIGAEANTRALTMEGAQDEVLRILAQFNRAMDRRFCKIVMENIMRHEYIVPVIMEFFVPRSQGGDRMSLDEFFDHEKTMLNVFNRPGGMEHVLKVVNSMDFHRKTFRYLKDSPWQKLTVSPGTGEHVRAMEYKRKIYEHGSFGARGDTMKTSHDQTLMKTQAQNSGLDIMELPHFFKDNDLLNPKDALAGEVEIGQFWVIPAHTTAGFPPRANNAGSWTPRQFIRVVDYKQNKLTRVSIMDIVNQTDATLVDRNGDATALARRVMIEPGVPNRAAQTVPTFAQYIARVGLDRYFADPALPTFDDGGNPVAFQTAYDQALTHPNPGQNFKEVCKQAYAKGVLIPFHGLVLRPHMLLARSDAVLTTAEPPAVIAHTDFATQVGVTQPGDELKIQMDVYAAALVYDPFSVQHLHNAQIHGFISGCGVNWKDEGNVERSLYGLLLPYDAKDVMDRKTLDVTGQYAGVLKRQFPGTGSELHYPGANELSTKHHWKCSISEDSLKRGVYQPHEARNTVVHRGYCDMPVLQEGALIPAGMYVPPADHFGVPYELNPAKRFISTETHNSDDTRLARSDLAYPVPELYID